MKSTLKKQGGVNMCHISAVRIFSEQRYLKLVDCVISNGGMSHAQSNKILEKFFEKSIKEEENAELFLGLSHASNLLAVFISESIFNKKTNFEEMIPETANRCLTRYVLCADREGLESYLPPDVIITAFHNLNRSDDSGVYELLADNFHEVIQITQEIIDEL